MKVQFIYGVGGPIWAVCGVQIFVNDLFFNKLKK